VPRAEAATADVGEDVDDVGEKGGRDEI